MTLWTLTYKCNFPTVDDVLGKSNRYSINLISAYFKLKFHKHNSYPLSTTPFTLIFKTSIASKPSLSIAFTAIVCVPGLNYITSEF
jgi:hypothetical protein